MVTPLPCFDGDSVLLLPSPVTHHPSRKQFFAKLLGVVAAASVLPKFLAKSAAAPGATTDNAAAKPTRGFEIRADARAVARRDTA